MVLGLYINSLIYGIEYRETKIDEEYRKELEKRAEIEGLENLYNEAYKIDEEAMKIISKNDKKRIIRVLEIYKETGKTKTEMDKLSREKEVEFDYKIFVLDTEREKLYENINKRVDQMLKQGLIEEVKDILNRYEKFPTAMQALGYKETKSYLYGEITKEEMIEKIKMETRRYAKRQLTWFRKNKEAIWLDMSKPKEENIEKIIYYIWERNEWWMSKKNKSYTNRKILVISSLIFAASILICFLSGLIGLIVEPSNIFAIENRNNLSGRNYIWIYNKRWKSS